jgi:hypothetical protein
VGTGRDRGVAILLNGVTDSIAPTIDITSPVDGARIPIGTPVALAFTCGDANAVASCTATDRGVAIANGANLPTAGTDVGPHTVVVTAKDNAGNTTTKSVTYNVVATANGGATGTVPATLALTLGAPASFGPFTPGVARVYTASTSATVISTAGDALLSIADPSSTATGRLMNGTFALVSPVQARATSPLGTGSPLANVGGSSAPTPLLTYSGPASNDIATVTFSQSIAANEPLRTGSYSKSLTFTLSTTTP